MQVCKSIEKVQGGYIVEIPFPYANYSDGQKRVFATWAEVLKVLTTAAHEEPSTEEPTPEASGVAGSYDMRPFLEADGYPLSPASSPEPAQGESEAAARMLSLLSFPLGRRVPQRR